MLRPWGDTLALSCLLWIWSSLSQTWSHMKAGVQADTYRRMRKAVAGQWERYCPATNALWLHYLTEMLLTTKACPCQASETRALRDFRCVPVANAACGLAPGGLTAACGAGGARWRLTARPPWCLTRSLRASGWPASRLASERGELA